MSAMLTHSWDSYEWESYGVQLLRQRYGVSLIPIPDGSRGDGGLDAYTSCGIGWQCYAPENEPLSPKKRYEVQRDKITSDLKKLIDNPVRVQNLLGDVVLHKWVLLTPRHESAELVAHCATKTREMRKAALMFLAHDFHVHVQQLSDFAIEHRMLQGAHVLPGGLHKPVKYVDLADDGQPFEKATGPLIDVMDGKLKHVVSNDAKRATLRAEYLRAKVAGDDKLAHFNDSMPDVAQELRAVIAAAKRRVRIAQALTTFSSTHLGSVQDDLSTNITALIPELTPGAVEQLAQGAIAQWIQECSMRFDDPDDSTAGENGDGGDE